MFVTTSCRKKAPKTACWAVSISDSTYSNIPDLAKKNAVTSSYEVCDYTSTMMTTFASQHSFKDTVMKTDTIVVNVQQCAYQVW